MLADCLARRPFLTLAGFVGLASLAGCATVVHGTHQNVQIKSNPSRATVYLDGKQVGHTPMTAAVSRRAHQTIKLTHDGYRPYIVHFQHHVSKVTGGNALAGGILGAAADAVDGANGYNTPTRIDVVLAPLGAGAIQAKPTIYAPATHGSAHGSSASSG